MLVFTLRSGIGLLPVIFPRDASVLPFSVTVVAFVVFVISIGTEVEFSTVVAFDMKIYLRPAVFAVWLSVRGGRRPSNPEMKP